MGIWDYRNVVMWEWRMWGYGIMECGNMGIWDCGDVGLWECGDKGTWDYVSMGIVGM